MASICYCCARRLQRETSNFPKRTFSSTASTQRYLPTFSESSNAELSEILSTIREKHFIPAYLHRNERDLIFLQKNRQLLADNPRTAKIGDEEIQLKWIDRRQDIPNRGMLVARALNMILNGDSNDWRNLPALLQGLKVGIKKPASDAQMEKIVRKALNAGKTSILIRCLQDVESTGMALSDGGVLRSVLLGLHQIAQSRDWNEADTGRALKHAQIISKLLEKEEHGAGRILAENDPRTRPEVLAVFLELAAVHAYKHAGAKDEGGLVKAYAGRLMSCVGEAGAEPKDLVLTEAPYRQWPMLRAIPIWHGLSIARKILGNDLPKPSVVQTMISSYETALSGLAEELEARDPKPGTYSHEALMAWKNCIRE